MAIKQRTATKPAQMTISPVPMPRYASRDRPPVEAIVDTRTGVEESGEERNNSEVLDQEY